MYMCNILYVLCIYTYMCMYDIYIYDISYIYGNLREEKGLWSWPLWRRWRPKHRFSVYFAPQVSFIFFLSCSKHAPCIKRAITGDQAETHTWCPFFHALCCQFPPQQSPKVFSNNMILLNYPIYFSFTFWKIEGVPSLACWSSLAGAPACFPPIPHSLRTMASNKTAGHSLIKATHWSPKPKDLRMRTDWGLGFFTR